MIAGSVFLAIGSFQECLNCNDIVKTVTISSAFLYGGLTESSSNLTEANLFISFNNPGAETYITSLSITLVVTMTTTNVNANPQLTSATTASASSNNGVTIVTWRGSENSTSQINFSANSQANALASDKLTTFDYFPRTVSPMNITAGEVWDDEIMFANGQSDFGTIVAQ
jgi:hypothetical protein